MLLHCNVPFHVTYHDIHMIITACTYVELFELRQQLRPPLRTEIGAHALILAQAWRGFIPVAPHSTPHSSHHIRRYVTHARTHTRARARSLVLLQRILYSTHPIIISSICLSIMLPLSTWTGTSRWFSVSDCVEQNGTPCNAYL